MRNGFLVHAQDLQTLVRVATEQFLGRFAADHLLSRSRALDRIARDLRWLENPPSSNDSRRSAEK